MFWGEQAGKRRFELRWKLKHEKNLKGCYLIVISEEDSSNLLDLIPAEELKKLSTNEQLLESVVIGMAEDKAEAIEVARVIIDTVYQKTGGLDIRKYWGLTENR